ncbi:stalk domain-containing protein [Candidatus Formimonas warabiya]|uniref:Copper amine oxidase-like N-terminal domain-containing protein n=1 Tax=Formimonas warabiya TaxID=1761012 RepID=A0A3G1KSU6_FORW1|nr:stalk domain-containing protein [Candidatus Formimonas warabiya]ATW25521.1 hypothetical protein DCMF_12765 [Candidatus Formimonas warabiya]
MKLDKKIITLCMTVIIFTLSSVFASQNIEVRINGQKQDFSPAPVLQNGSTLIPMRPFFEALGASVNWDSTHKTVVGRRDNTVVELTINKKIAIVNGKEIFLSLPGKIINGNTFIPLRFVGESLGDDVDWNPQTNTISITVHRIPNYLALGNKYFYATDFENALEMYKKANEVNLSDPVPYFKIGITLQNLNKLDEALYYFDKAIELDPYCAYGYLYKGYILYGRGDLEGAQKCYDMYDEIKLKYPKESKRCSP